MKKIVLLFVALLAMSVMHAQQSARLFQSISPAQVQLPENTRRGAFPQKFDTYQVPYESLKTALAAAPQEFTTDFKSNKCIVNVPIGSGATDDFAIWEIAMLDDAGRQQFPEIHTYAGRSTTNPLRTVRLSITVRGFRAMVMQPDYEASFVEPYAWGQTTYYLAYNRADAADNGLQHLRATVKQDGSVAFGERPELFAPEAEYRGQELDPLKLKVYRLCVGGNGEYGQDHGTTKQEVFAATTEYANQISAIYERDIALRLQLIGASFNVSFVDPLTDPYTGTTVNALLEQNSDILNTYCNFNSHDVGHVLTRYFQGDPAAGVGALGVVCGVSKASGCSSGQGTGDYGPGFLQVFGQELGHQLSGGHTWNRCNGGGGRDGITAFEPGSGSTIMSYAGACGDDNVQTFADLYFNTGSIVQIKTYYQFFGVCGSYIQTNNHDPEVVLNYPDNFTIPISTPFELKGSATDMDGDALSYCWEEIDAGPETPLGAPAGNAAIFRTISPQSVSNRYFPRLSVVINNGSNITEQLPTYSRDLTFRLTVRDNVPNGGGLGAADVAFKAYDGAGPFTVSSPNTNTNVWLVGEYVNVTWNVANTNLAPVNCQKVNIRLSTDGGQTYPVTLASGVPNDGSQYVLVPPLEGTTNRVRVDAADNVFYDISNSNFKIQQPTQPSFTFGLAIDGGIVCLPDYFSTDIFSAGVLGFNTPASLSLDGSLPPGAIGSFSTTTIQPGASSVFNLDLTQVAVEGIFTFNVKATVGNEEYLRPVTVELRRNDFTGLALQTPANGLTNAALTQTLRWGKGLDADAYDVQFSLNPSFDNILASKTATALDSFKINFLLQKGTAYFWRVRPINACGAHDWSEPYFFSTFAEDCRIVEANDLPKNISTNGTPTVETQVTVNQGGIISGINIKQIQGNHSFFKDLEAHLVSPQGTDVMLWKEKCGNFNGNFNFGLDDAAPGAFPCPPNNVGSIYRPVNPMTPFVGESSTGTWKFRLRDNVLGSGGTLSGFKIEFCASITVTPPFLVNNNIMPLPSGTSRVITPDFLLVEDVDNTHAELVYTVMSVPEHGLVDQLGVGTLQPGDKFTQANLDAGDLRFYDYGTSTSPDGFRFMVTDGEGGFMGTPKFVAQPLVGAHEPSVQVLDFMLFPNPASETVQLAFGEALEANTRVQLIDMAGREMGTWSMDSGASSLSIQVKNMPKGIYLVSVRNQAGSGIKKLVVR
jgi:subtilisin-like proprotein convertase family protein